MIEKLQQGGSILQQIQQLPEKEKAQIFQAFSTWAQKKGINVQELQKNPKALEQALGQFIQEIQSQKTSARHGAKLNYIKSLKHQCADDEELYYYKKGGSLGCGCKKKKEGGEVEKAQNGAKAVDKFKRDQAAKDSIEANVHNNQDIQNNVSGKTPGNYKKNKQGKMQWTPDRTKAPYKKTEKKEKGSKIEKNCGGSAVTKFKMKCGDKLKKHFFGGTI